MELEDRLTIRTPEGVELSLTLAGPGSRIAAALLDFLIQAIVIVVLIIAILAAVDDDSVDLAIGLGVVVYTVIFFGYPILFELLDGGRSIGKRAAGLRVVLLDGGPAGFGAIAIRNVLRLIDFLPLFYGVGLLSIVLTRHHQRLGDLASGAIVIRERTVAPRRSLAPAVPADPGRVPLDVTAVGVEEIALIQRFLDRRESLPQPRRAALAADIAQRVTEKVALVEPVGDPELFLARVLAEKASRS